MIAKSMGYENSFSLEGDANELKNLINDIPESLSFINVKVSKEQNFEVPRVSIDPEEISSRFSRLCLGK